MSLFTRSPDRSRELANEVLCWWRNHGGSKPTEPWTVFVPVANVLYGDTYTGMSAPVMDDYGTLIITRAFF